MDIQKFQQKLTEVCELGEKNGKVLKPEQIKECFGELDLDKSQLIKILQYLKLKGISIEGAEEISAASQPGPEEVSEEKEEKVFEYKIDRAVIFPFNKEMHNFVRYPELLDFKVMEVYDTKYSSNVGRKTTDVMIDKSVKEYCIKNIDDIKCITFTERDVVRHKLVQDIIKAYERNNEEAKRKNG